jgi:hypothetical protein
MPAKEDKLIAPYTMGMLFPSLGAVFASIFALYVYVPHKNKHFYMGYENNEVPSNIHHTRFASTITIFYEPFSVATNLSIWFSGLSFFIWPYISKKEMPSHAFGMGMLLSLLGVSSAAFHKFGSVKGNWAHALDRVFMYCPMIYLALLSPFATYCVVSRRKRTQCDLTALISHIFCLAGLSIVPFQDELNTTTVLLATGIIVVTCGAVSMAIMESRLYAYHSKPRSILRRSVFILYYVSSLIIPLYCGMELNMKGDRFMEMANSQDSEWSHLVLREYRIKHDIYHGVWHILIAQFLLTTTLFFVESITEL